MLPLAGCDAEADADAEDVALLLLLSRPLLAEPNRLADGVDDEPVDGVVDETLPKRDVRGADEAVAVVVALPPASLPLGLVFRLGVEPPKRFRSSSVEKAAPVRAGDECLDDSADVLLSELADLCAGLNRSVTREMRPLDASSWLTELLDGVRDRCAVAGARTDAEEASLC